MRNGDYSPTRVDVQNEAANYIASVKAQSNRENSIGVMTSAGSRVDILLTPVSDTFLVLKSINELSMGGKSNFSAALRTAQLCLKNRQNKNQRQRVVLFVGSPVGETQEELVLLGKSLKKNNVAVDVINFGTENCSDNDNTEKLDAFVQSVNSGDVDTASKLVVVPPGPHNFVDMIVTTLFGGEAGGGGGVGEGIYGAGFAADYDPDMELAIRMSLDEARENAPEEAGSGEAIDEDMDDELARALAMSMEEDVPEEATASVEQSNLDDALADPDFMNDLLAELDVGQSGMNVEDLLNSLDEDPKDKNSEKKPEKDA